MKELYSLRSQTIERVFADAKELYQMRYTRYRGIKRVTMELTLKFACMNLKKLAVWKDRDSIKRAISHGFFFKLLKNLLNLQDIMPKLLQLYAKTLNIMQNWKNDR